MQSRFKGLALLLLVSGMFVGACPCEASSWRTDADGTIWVDPPVVPEPFRNAPWPEAWEKAFRERSTHVIRTAARKGGYGSTYFENEKRAYGWAMLSILGGYEEEGLQFLQSEDAQADQWHRHTKGIDFYACFTLKHQMRKFFYFGDRFAPDYRQRMVDGAKIWTESEPLDRKHYAFTDTGVWGPDKKGVWVDGRGTDNLKLMRDCAVYLFAEETGNEETRRLYKEKIRKFVVFQYHYGMGEWDSENYLGHSFAPVLSLYDFAKDPEVRLLAKASLDHMAAAAAVKYWRGVAAGPTKRDYNHPYAFGGSLAGMFWMYFGEAPHPNEELESDEIHIITSAYRPPRAVVHLARRQFQRPTELYAAKPDWQPWRNNFGDVALKYRETTYFGKTFQLGSLLKGTQEDDVNGFKLLTESAERGADVLMAGPIADPTKLGSIQYTEGNLDGESRVAQCGPVAIYLCRDSEIPFLWMFHKDFPVQMRDGIMGIETETTHIAVHPVGLTIEGVDDVLTQRARFSEKSGELIKKWPHLKVVDSAIDAKAPFYGFAIEVVEKAGSLESFLARQQKEAKVIVETKPGSDVAFHGVGGRSVRIRWQDNQTRIERDGKERDWAKTGALYQPAGDSPVIIEQRKETGRLTVTAGGERFTCNVTPEGAVAFQESQP